MNPFDKLRLEHQVLWRMVDAFEIFLNSTGARDHLAADFATFVHFFRDVAVRGHHEKEERVLDPFLVQCEFDWDTTPLVGVRDYHDSERNLTHILQQAVNDGLTPQFDSSNQLMPVCKRLIASQRQHIELEDSLVFPIAEQKLDADERAALAWEMLEYERTRGGADALGDTLHGAQLLCERYGPPLVPT